MDGRTELPLLPDACLLSAEEGAARVARWRRLTERAATSRRRAGGELRVAFAAPTDAQRDELRALVEAERSCCSSLSWSLDDVGDAVQLVVVGPAAELDRIDAL